MIRPTQPPVFTTDSDAEEMLERFEQAWQNGTPPALEGYVPPARPHEKPAADQKRYQLLHELIKIDLEYQWRRRCPAKLEAYLVCYPELRQAEAIYCGLIGEEYRSRHRWGDRPGHAEYATRFPDRWPGLRDMLVMIDADLSVEFAHERKRAAPLAAPGVAPRSMTRSATMNQSVTVSSLLDSLQRYRLLDSAQASAAADLPQRFPEPRDLGRELLKRGWLTAYQVNQLLQGRGQDLVLGPYLLLERLGEGGTGQVFKARHLAMNRIAAVKVIRKDLLHDAEALGRFLREIHVTSQLTGPHVVHAYDSGPVGSSYYLAMEYVNGIDLSRLVKQVGALPIGPACDYIQQAALGLQHLHEKGLVHRDIKPSNLMLAGLVDPGKGLTPPPGCVVKILDMGLARLHRSLDEMTRDLTGNNAVLMGTLDYMAPEQGQSFHAADIRSDVYSLGCTFYFLLTSQPPFAGGTIPQKVVRHMQEEPAPLEQFRRDLPPGLTALVSRMMAKQPHQRFQTPAEVARALEAFASAAPLALPVPAGRSKPLLAVTVRPPMLPAGEVIVVNAPQRASPVLHVRNWLRRPPRRRLILAGGIAALLVLGFFGWLLMSGKSEEVFLSDLPETKVFLTQSHTLGKNGAIPGWGNPQKAVISVGGKASPKGLCTPPPGPGAARVSYKLNKQFRQFKATVALPDAFPECPTPLTFSVSGDGRPLWQSKPVKKRGDEQEFTLQVSGIDVLELTVACPGTAKNRDGSIVTYPVWIDPRLSK